MRGSFVLRLVVVAGLVLAAGAPMSGPAQASQTASAAALAGFNGEFGLVWQRLSPEIERYAAQQLESQLLAQRSSSGGFDVSVGRVRSVTVSIGRAPGFRQIATDRVELAIPLQGGWEVAADVDVHLQYRAGLLTVGTDVQVQLAVRDIALVTTVQIDDTDPTRPVIRRVDQPNVSFTVQVGPPGPFSNVLNQALNPVGSVVAQSLVNQAIGRLAPNLAGLAGYPGPVPADGAPPYADSGAPTPFLDVVRSVDRKIVRDHLPHGTLVEALMDTPAYDTWEAAYGRGGPGNVGRVVGYEGAGDSAIWTGHYLASQAFRYAATRERAALSNVRTALRGIGALLDVNGGTGLLARVAAPVNSIMGQDILRDGPFRQAVIRGETWVGRQGGNGISRDQYDGVFFGLAITYDLVSDRAIRAECARRIRQMLDYLVARAWYVDEDRPPFSVANAGGFPTFWAAVDGMRLSFLLAGRRVSGARYDAEIARITPLVETSWLDAWLSTFNLDSYFKFNLTFISYYSYFRLETDRTRWQHMMRAFRIDRRYAGHHRNPHFDLIQLAVEPALRAGLAPSVREEVRRFLQRNHRTVGPAVVDLSGVTWQTFTMPIVDDTGNSQMQQFQLPTEPIDIPIRRTEGFFLWQRSPFQPAQAGQGNPYDESPGIDLVLPYWMGRYHRVFP